MKELGLAMLLVGLVSLALPFINPNIHYFFLTWIDQWGPRWPGAFGAVSRWWGWCCGCGGAGATKAG